MMTPHTRRRFAESLLVAGLLVAACQAAPPPTGPVDQAPVADPAVAASEGPKGNSPSTAPSSAPAEVPAAAPIAGTVLLQGKPAVGFRLEAFDLRTGQVVALAAASYALAHEGEAHDHEATGATASAPALTDAQGGFRLSLPTRSAGDAWKLVASSPDGKQSVSLILAPTGPAKLRLAQAAGAVQLNEATTALAMMLEPAVKAMAALKREAAAAPLSQLLADVAAQQGAIQKALDLNPNLGLRLQAGEGLALDSLVKGANLQSLLAEKLSTALVAAAKLAEKPEHREPNAPPAKDITIPGIAMLLQGALHEGKLSLTVNGQRFDAAKGDPKAIGQATGSSGGGGGGGGSSSSSSTADASATAALSFDFKAVVGSDDLTFTMEDPASSANRIPRVYTGIGTSNASITPVDFRFYVHDVEVRKQDGSWASVSLDENTWQHEGTALMDFEDNTGSASPNGTSATHTVLTGVGPSGTLTGLRFKLGVPEKHNHKDVAVAPAPLNVSRLYWSWQSGRKHARLDFTSPDRPATSSTFNIHLGATGCAADANATGSDGYACTTTNVATVELTGFNPSSKSILADLKALVANTNVAVESGGPGGCMSGATDNDCTGVMRNFGLSFQSGTNPNGQQFFRVAN